LKERNQEEGRRKIYMMFADLKAAFDKMDKDCERFLEARM